MVTIGTTIDLIPGDILHSIGTMTFSPSRPHQYTVITAPTVVGETTAQVCTSHTDYIVPSDAEVSYSRPETTPALLISRRAYLHGEVLALGTPVTRRTPVTDDDTAPAVTAEEWEAATVILIDGHLAYNTIISMWEREEFTPIDKQIIMVGTDMDDQRIYQRANVACALGIAMLPDASLPLGALLADVINDHPIDV